MRMKKVLKFILLVVLIFLAIRFLSRFTFGEMWEWLKNFNLEITENPIGLFFIF